MQHNTIYQAFALRRMAMALLAGTTLALGACGGGGGGDGAPAPAPNPTPATKPALKVVGNKLQDSTGAAVMLRGVNVSVYKSGYADDMAAVAQAVKSSKANAARLVWWSDAANTNGNPTQYTLANLDAVLTQYHALGILPVLELHDGTCWLAKDLTDGDFAKCNDRARFKARITDWYTRPDVMAIIKKHQGHLVVNLANEWGRTKPDFVNPDAAAVANYVQNYADAIAAMRTAWGAQGIAAVPLMVDAPDNGTNVDVLVAANAGDATKTNAEVIAAADSKGNTFFAVHSYWSGVDVNWIDEKMIAMANSPVPMVFGETGTAANGAACDAYPVKWHNVYEMAYLNSLGTLAWAWYEEGACNDMNITFDGVTVPADDGDIHSYRRQTLYHPQYGLKTAVPIPMQ